MLENPVNAAPRSTAMPAATTLTTWVIAGALACHDGSHVQTPTAAAVSCSAAPIPAPAASNTEECREREKKYASECSFSTWYPEGACGEALEALSDGRRGDATRLVEDCAWVNQAFAKYLRATMNRRTTDVTRAREDLEGAAVEARAKSCKPCESLAERDLALSLLLQDPQDEARAHDLLLSSCQRLLEEPMPHLDSRLGTHPCELAPSSTYKVWALRDSACSRLTRGCRTVK